MRQKDITPLLKDLCARLPYRPKIWSAESDSNDNLKSIWYDDLEGWQVDGDNLSAPVFVVKPYLFPLSNMTDEQIYKSPFGYATMDTIRQEEVWSDITVQCKGYHHIIDWLNKNHFDYRGLIPMGLANDATGLNIY